MELQSALRAIYPPRCLTCDGRTETDHALCPDCWRDTPFIAGTVCDGCGLPVTGDPDGGDRPLCDDCITIARPWSRGRAVMLYDGRARDILLRLKYGDRTDYARPAGRWMAAAARPLLRPGMLVAPVPLHWMRLFRRRYNQSALLARSVSRTLGLELCPDLLVRTRRTPPQEGQTRAGRFANQRDAMRLHPRRGALVEGRPILLVDDVMTSGATLAAAAEACLAAGSGEVAVIVLARVAKEP